MKKLYLFLTCISFMACLNAQVITNGLIAYYPMNGTGQDLSGNNLNGTPTNPTPTIGHNGYNGSAYLFNGTSDYITVPQNNLLAPANQLSVSVWINIKSFYAGRDQGNMIVANGNEIEPFWQFSYYDGDMQPFVLDTNSEKVAFAIRFSDGTNAGVLCPTPIHTNNWYHLCFTYDGYMMKLYVNNTLVDTTQISKTMGIPSTPMTIGRYFHPSQPTVWPYYVNGIIDELYIFDRALDTTEINTLCNEAHSSLPPSSAQNSIMVYPNPANDQISIDFGSNYSTMTGYTLKITNSLSQVMYTTPIDQQLTSVDLSTWTGNGIYFVHLIDGQGNTIDIRKIVLQ